MANERERYSKEDKAALQKLSDENPTMMVKDLLDLAVQAMPHRSLPALKQQLFKLRREASPKKKPMTKKKSAKKPTSPGKTPRAPGDTQPARVNGAEITVNVATDKQRTVRVTGAADDVAQLIRSL